MPSPTRQPEPTTPFFGSTYLEMQGDVLRPLGYTTTTAPTNLLAETKRLIKTSVAQICAMHANDFWVEKYTTITTVADQATYALPKGVIRIISVVLDSVYIDAMPDDYKNKLYATRNVNPYDEGTATQFYCVYGVDNGAATTEPLPILELYPPPSEAGTIVLRYRGHDNALSADGDYFRSAPGFQQMPVWYSAGVILLTSGEISRAESFMSLYNDENMKLTAVSQRSRAEKDTYVLPSFGKSRFPTQTSGGQIP